MASAAELSWLLDDLILKNMFITVVWALSLNDVHSSPTFLFRAMGNMSRMAGISGGADMGMGSMGGAGSRGGGGWGGMESPSQQSQDAPSISSPSSSISPSTFGSAQGDNNIFISGKDPTHVREAEVEDADVACTAPCFCSRPHIFQLCLLNDSLNIFKVIYRWPHQLLITLTPST